MLYDDYFKEMVVNFLNIVFFCFLCEEFEGILLEKRVDLYFEII